MGKEQIKLDTEKKKTKADKQKLTAMKRMTKQSRKGSESDDPDDDEEEEESCDKATLRRKKRVRRSVNDAICYLQEKAKKDYSLKME